MADLGFYWLAGCIGAVLGALGVWAYCAPKLSACRTQIQQLTTQLERLEQESAQLRTTAEHQLETERQQYRIAIEARDSRITELLQECSRLSAEAEHLRQRLEEDRAHREQLQHQLQLEFEQLATRILQERSVALKEQSTDTLEKLLSPLRERIAAFEEKVERAYLEHTKGTATLREQLNQLFQLNAQLSQHADSLVTALRGDKRLQGSWGEIQLERLLELSGLQRGIEYELQVSTHSSEGERIRPDVVIYLPEGKHLVVDSKVSLSAYIAMIESTTDDDRQRYLRHHVAAIRQHIERLSAKDYSAAVGIHSPEFVLLFMPIEAALSAALHADRELYTYAWERRIVLTSPTTLLATLRTVASVWKHERHNRTALDIAEEAGKLHDKLASVLDDFVKVGHALERTKRDYDEAMRRLCTGPGNVVTRALRMVELGAKAKKELNPALVQRASDEDSIDLR